MLQLIISVKFYFIFRTILRRPPPRCELTGLMKPDFLITETLGARAKAHFDKAYKAFDIIRAEGRTDANFGELGIDQDQLNVVSPIKCRDHFGHRGRREVQQPVLPSEHALDFARSQRGNLWGDGLGR